MSVLFWNQVLKYQLNFKSFRVIFLFAYLGQLWVFSSLFVIFSLSKFHFLSSIYNFCCYHTLAVKTIKILFRVTLLIRPASQLKKENLNKGKAVHITCSQALSLFLLTFCPYISIGRGFAITLNVSLWPLIFLQGLLHWAFDIRCHYSKVSIVYFVSRPLLWEYI
jgi:hypothetical protein